MKKIILPKRSEMLAEFFGICFGDGCLSVNESNHDYSFYVTGHLLDDKLYIENYLFEMVRNLFKIDPRLRKQKGNTLILYARSKKLIQFLASNGMQIGKKNNLVIPDWIKQSPNFMKAFLRGFIDTDGSLTFKKRHTEVYYYPTISISSMNQKLILDIHTFLRENDFQLGKVVKTQDSIKGLDKTYTHFRVFLYGKENLEKWIKSIGFSNMKHTSKYILWKKHGFSPAYSLTRDRIKIIKGPLSEI